MTWWCAKGLQFKDVFIPGCETSFTPDKRAALYVAMTRCSERLYLAYSGHLNDFSQRIPLQYTIVLLTTTSFNHEAIYTNFFT